ncbi:MAG: PKD domain-containing protein [Candidatus Brocadiia bacterium]
MTLHRANWLSLCALLLAAALSGRPAEAQVVRPEWWDAAWRYRALLKVPAKGPGAYRAWIFAGDRARPDGSDIRVVAPLGRPVDFAVVRSTPAGQHLIVFSEPQGDHGGGTYAVYFGNPAAPAVEQKPPQMGLMLKTLEMPQGMSGATWTGVQESLGRARLYGMDFWKQVFDAYNPFGPQSRYISVYDGFLECPKAGVYKFATMSDDGSFMLVDGELVAEWPGQGHNIDESRHGEKNGQRNLAAGRHAFRYVGLAFDGGRRMAAVWTPPGASAWQIIPPSAFPSVFAVPVLETDDSTRPVCAAFGMEEFQYLECGSARMVAVQFTSESGAQAAALTQWFWEFGDGLISRERDPVHVYMLPGRYQVTHTTHAADQSSDSFTLTIAVEPLRQDQDFSFARRQQFWFWVQDYPVDKLATKPLLAFRSFLKEIEEPRRVFDAGIELDRRRADLNKAQLHSVALDLAEYYTEPLRNWQAAEKYYLLALDQLGRQEIELRADIRFKLAELHFYYAGDAAKAEAELAALRDDLPKSDATRRRKAALQIGDIERDQGHADAARKIYLAAESDPAFLPKEPRAIADGRFAQQAEAQIREGDGDAALARLDEWLWAFPTKRLDGPPVVLRLKAQLLRKKYGEVRRDAATWLKFATDPDCIPEVQVLAGRACAAMGEKDAARVFFQGVIEKWPESPAVAEAKSGLEQLK